MDVRKVLIEAGAELPEAERERILALGAGSVVALLEVFGDEGLAGEEDAGAGWAPVHAARLLGELGDERAVPALLEEFLEGDYDALVYNAAALALPKHGQCALEPLLAAYREHTDWEMRWSLCTLLSVLGVRDERIYDALCECLPHHLACVAGCFGEYGDSRGLPLLEQAFDALELDGTDSPWNTWESFSELGHAIEALGGTLDDGRLEKIEAAAALRDEEGGGQEWNRDSLLSDAERGAMGRVFTGRGRARSLWSARGFLAAVGCSPSLSSPGLWLGELLPPLERRQDAQAVLDTLQHAYNASLSALDADATEVLCPQVDQADATVEFCFGFLDAVALDPEWLAAGVGEAELVALKAVAEFAEANPDKRAGVGAAMAKSLPDHLSAIYEGLAVARIETAERLMRERQSVRVGPKVGRNEPCPCGSGKKYKRCCLAAAN